MAARASAGRARAFFKMSLTSVVMNIFYSTRPCKKRKDGYPFLLMDDGEIKNLGHPPEGVSLLRLYGFTKVASMVEFPPAVTVIVRCQGVRFSFSTETRCSPGVNWIVDGVLPMYLPSTFMSQPGGVDFTITLTDGIADSA